MLTVAKIICVLVLAFTTGVRMMACVVDKEGRLADMLISWGELMCVIMLAHWIN